MQRQLRSGICFTNDYICYQWVRIVAGRVLNIKEKMMKKACFYLNVLSLKVLIVAARCGACFWWTNGLVDDGFEAYAVVALSGESLSATSPVESANIKTLDLSFGVQLPV